MLILVGQKEKGTPVIANSLSHWAAYLHIVLNILLLKKMTLFLFIFRERGREEERQGEKHRSVASCTCPDQGSNLQPRHASQLEI